MPDSPLNVGGVTRFTTIDFPGRMAAVIFCQGCPWRCRYCHNPHLHDFKADGGVRWSDVLAWLKTRRGLLTGVVFSGGEPLMQPAISEAIDEVRALGFAVALHTSGVYPDRLAKVIDRVDWVGLDIKASFEDYAEINGAGAGANAQRTLKLLIDTKTPFELRTTVDPEFFTPETASKMALDVKNNGGTSLILQTYRDIVTHEPVAIPQAVIDAVKEHLDVTVRS